MNNDVIEYFKMIVDEINENRNHMLGYPANYADKSPDVLLAEMLDDKIGFANNCGPTNATGNYKMDSKRIEKQILEKVASNLGLTYGNKSGDYAGYIGTGGTEGNAFGIKTGLSKYNYDAIVYYSNQAHYSIEKNLDKNIIREVISSLPDGQINFKELLVKCIYNYKKYNKPAVIILTQGTTVLGAVDNIELIEKMLKLNNIPYYMHVDAAQYGGIPKNSINAPVIDYSKLDVDSISISLHKYFGCSEAHGVILYKSDLEKNKNYISYIGQFDTTICGSRSIRPFSTYCRVNDILNSDKNDYIENINFFEELLIENGIEYKLFKDGNIKGNTFLLPKPSQEICEYYQLAEEIYDNKEYVHVIIFPYHNKEVLRKFVNELSNNYQYKKL